MVLAIYRPEYPDPNRNRVPPDYTHTTGYTSTGSRGYHVPSSSTETKTPYKDIKKLLSKKERKEFFETFSEKPVHENSDALKGLEDKLRGDFSLSDDVSKKNLAFLLDYNHLVNKLQSNEPFDDVDVEKLIKLEATIAAYSVSLPS